MALLELDKLSLSFGGLRAISELDLEVSDNEIVSIIGPNGAGKSSVFNVISGVYLPTEGDVRLGGRVDRRLQAPQDRPQGDRPHVSKPAPVSESDGQRERQGGDVRQHEGLAGRVDPASATGPARRT